MQKLVTEKIQKEGMRIGRIIAEKTEQEPVAVKMKENVWRTTEKHWLNSGNPRMKV